MQNVVFTQLSIPEFREIIRQELARFFSDKANVVALSKTLQYDKETLDNDPIGSIQMSVRLYNILIDAKVTTVGQMRNIDKKTFLRIRNAGKKTWGELEGIVSRL